eukprot:CAMPEP_0177659460 /NCGR_PEP_ID=MMETSP0447-20121125/17455_1 /TAXON_ID=0 /ORGANISM="Stygamoeba regulata, Strain BSH-02190019" /LENGTH=767 /DNA_ID=CAMNT_0019164333 /DNA_START=499 /DNA_END=2804 /DNA_ORIENTATION=+
MAEAASVRIKEELTAAEGKLAAAKKELAAAEAKLAVEKKEYDEAKKQGDDFLVGITKDNLKTAQAGVATAHRLVDHFTTQLITATLNQGKSDLHIQEDRYGLWVDGQYKAADEDEAAFFSEVKAFYDRAEYLLKNDSYLYSVMSYLNFGYEQIRDWNPSSLLPFSVIDQSSGTGKTQFAVSLQCLCKNYNIWEIAGKFADAGFYPKESEHQSPGATTLSLNPSFNSLKIVKKTAVFKVVNLCWVSSFDDLSNVQEINKYNKLFLSLYRFTRPITDFDTFVNAVANWFSQLLFGKQVDMKDFVGRVTQRELYIFVFLDECPYSIQHRDWYHLFRTAVRSLGMFLGAMGTDAHVLNMGDTCKHSRQKRRKISVAYCLALLTLPAMVFSPDQEKDLQILSKDTADLFRMSRPWIANVALDILKEKIKPKHKFNADLKPTEALSVILPSLMDVIYNTKWQSLDDNQLQEVTLSQLAMLCHACYKGDDSSACSNILPSLHSVCILRHFAFFSISGKLFCHENHNKLRTHLELGLCFTGRIFRTSKGVFNPGFPQFPMIKFSSLPSLATKTSTFSGISLARNCPDEAIEQKVFQQWWKGPQLTNDGMFAEALIHACVVVASHQKGFSGASALDFFFKFFYHMHVTMPPKFKKDFARRFEHLKQIIIPYLFPSGSNAPKWDGVGFAKRTQNKEGYDIQVIDHDGKTVFKIEVKDRVKSITKAMFDKYVKKFGMRLILVSNSRIPHPSAITLERQYFEPFYMYISTPGKEISETI